MKYFIYAFMTVLLASCAHKAGNEATKVVTPIHADSSTTKADSLMLTTQHSDVPKSADDYFNDFIYSFITNQAYQSIRIVFPLPYLQNGKKSYLQRKDWHFTKLHAENPIYTVFFDSKKSIELEKSSDVSAVKIECFNMENQTVRFYSFKKEEGRWMLFSMEDALLEHYPDADFIAFYQQFATDARFQMKHVKREISVSVPDPNDEFEYINGMLDAKQWASFCPELPANQFTNIDYGQSSLLKNRRVVAIEGSSNGFQTLLFFTKEASEWILYRLEN